MNKKDVTLRLLEKLKSDRLSLTESNSFGFASKTLELIKISVGEKSMLFNSMQNLFYDRTVLNLERTVVSAQYLIFVRVNNVDGLYDSIIDSCIELVNNYGLFKPISEKKNFLGDLDNSMLWSFIVLFATASFFAGVFTMNFGLSKYFDLNENHENDHKLIQTPILKDTLLPVQQKKSQINLKGQ